MQEAHKLQAGSAQRDLHTVLKAQVKEKMLKAAREKLHHLQGNPNNINS